MSDFPSAPPPMGMSSGTPATFGQRVIAYLIDMVIGAALTLPGFVLFFIGSAIGGGFGVLVLLVGLLLALAGALAALYIFFMGIATEGQTPGKRMQGVRVVTDSGEFLGLGGAVIRWLVAGISNSILCGLPLGSLWMLFDADKKTLYDKILNNQAQSVPTGELMPLFPGGKPF